MDKDSVHRRKEEKGKGGGAGTKSGGSWKSSETFICLHPDCSLAGDHTLSLTINIPPTLPKATITVKNPQLDSLQFQAETTRKQSRHWLEV